LGFAWHSLRDDFETRFPCFTVASRDANELTSWEQWRQKWLDNADEPLATSRWGDRKRALL
jgi:hypothetical protein